MEDRLVGGEEREGRFTMRNGRESDNGVPTIRIYGTEVNGERINVGAIFKRYDNCSLNRL